MSELTPREIVSELDKYIIGQKEAKKSCCYRFKKQMAQNAGIKRS